MTYTHASLFSGIGGAELAASWLGWTNVFHCEIQEFQRKVLEYWFPNSVSYEDITKTDFSEWRGRIDVLTGGFPCQPFSVAGKRKGAEDNRYLWREMLRAIRQIQPTWVVGENVNGILSMVQPGKETKMGRTDDLFDENFIYRKEQKFTIEAICEDLESAGYSVQPIVIPACAVGAPHRRDRVWIVAHRTDTGIENLQQEWQDGVSKPSFAAHTDSQRRTRRAISFNKWEKTQEKWASLFSNIERPCIGKDVANSANARSESVQQGRKDRISELGLTIDTKCERWAKGGNEYGKSEISQEKECRAEQFSGTDSPQSWWGDFPSQSPVCNRDDGLPFRVADLTISFAKWRNKSIEALGNAWVPQVAFEVFKAIENYDK